jgi:DNA-binding transcriptional LysR family regulator
MSINLELYKVFYHVIKEGSFSKAANALYVSQSAISQAIKSLEEQLSQQLIIRLPRGIKLTKSGEVLFSHVEPAFNIIVSGEKQLTAINNMKRGVVTLSASDTICMYYLPKYLTKFNKAYPDISIKIFNRTTSETIAILKKGIAEIGLINIHNDVDNSLIVLKKEQLQDCFFVSKKSGIDTSKKYSLFEISKLPLILLEKGTSTRDHIDSFFNKTNIILKPEIELGSVDLLIRYATLNMGVICVAKQYVTQSPYKEQLVQLKISLEIPKRYIGIVKLKNVPISKASSEFLDIIIKDNV